MQAPLVQWFDQGFINDSTPGGMSFNSGESEIIRIKGENAYKRSAAWHKKYRQAWIS